MKVRKSELQLETVVSRILYGELDLQPNFQRGEVWDLKRQQRLIDSVLRDWYVPAVHLVIESDGREVVLDGQQRLAAIRDFVTDRFKVNGKTEPESEEIQALDGKRFSELPDAVRRAINRFEIQVIRLTEYEPGEPNELFFRLNQAYNLTPAEKRNALHGPARDQVERLVKELVGVGLLNRERVGFANGRLAYDDIIARTCVAISIGSMRLHINNNVVEEFYRANEFPDAAIEGVRAAGLRLLTQIEHAPERVRFNKGTLQTWLLYCYWAPQISGELPLELLGRFELERAAVKRGESGLPSSTRYVSDIVGIYDDRASYRVTDVSSVVARDLAVHLYSVATFGTPAIMGTGELLTDLDINPHASSQSVLSDYLDAIGWDPLAQLARP